MRSTLRRILRRLGLEVSRVRRTPFEQLLDAPRYTPMSVELLGEQFEIADSLSFYWSFREIFIDQIYRFNSERERPFIVDCGANYGTSVAYFKSVYPACRVIAVEPDPAIFGLLSRNVHRRGYSDVTLLNKAISNRIGWIDFHREGADGGRLAPIEGCGEVARVDTVRLDDLVDQRVDFLKMDIEGAESEAICSSERLHNVEQLFVEYHSFKGANQTLSELLEKLRSGGFRYYVRTQFCSPRPLVEERLQLGMDLQLNIFATRRPPATS